MKSFIQYISEVVTTEKDVSAIRKTREVNSFSDGSLTGHRTRYDFKHPDGKRHVTVDYAGTTDGHHPKEDDKTRMKKHPKRVEMSWTVHTSKRALTNKTRRGASTEHTKNPSSVEHTAKIMSTVASLHHRELSSTKAEVVWAKSKGTRNKINTRMSDRGDLEHKDWNHNVHHPEDEHSGEHSYFEWERKKK
jgi:hypothetical protein